MLRSPHRRQSSQPPQAIESKAIARAVLCITRRSPASRQPRHPRPGRRAPPESTGGRDDAHARARTARPRSPRRPRCVRSTPSHSDAGTRPPTDAVSGGNANPLNRIAICTHPHRKPLCPPCFRGELSASGPSSGSRLVLRVQCPFRRQQRTTEDTEITEWVDFRLDILLCFLCPLWLLTCSG